MAGSESHERPRCSARGPRRQRGRAQALGRGAVLTLVFASVLATGAATNSLPQEEEASTERANATSRAGAGGRDGTGPGTGTAVPEEVTRAAAKALAEGKSPTEAAEEVVSRSGDRWGAVYDKKEYEEFEQALDGEYTGVGLWGRRTLGGLVEVTRVQPGGPAARSGIGPGDTIRTVDGASVAKRPVTEVMAQLRGETVPGAGTGDGPGSEAAAGTLVRVGLERDGRRWTESLRRARLSTESVSVGRIEGGALRIRVESFTRGTGERVRDVVRDAPEGTGVVLDLRGNGGGLVSEAVEAASAFLDGGLVATYDVGGEQRALYARPGGDTGRPLVVLVDGGTMSAAELLTGALQDRGRAVTVGSRTFGKGSVQMPSKLADGSVAELTVGHYRTPAGHAVDGRGVTPDLAVREGVQEHARTVLGGLGVTP
ncbi:S41 family peptidase [Streptomyces sp. NPDC001780]